MNTSTEFLDKIWSLSKGEWAFIPWMTSESKHWSEGQPRRVTNGVPTYGLGVSPEVADVYFSPLKFITPQRRKGMLGDPGVIFADLDSGCDKIPFDMKPSALVETSPGHFHGYWFLRNPVSPAVWEPASKGWSQKIGADPGGWDATQVLRVPGTLNHKFNPPHVVTLDEFHPNRVYEITDFPTAATISVGDLDKPPLPSQTERDYLIKAGIEDDRLPLSARYWLTAGSWEIEALGSIDRSKIMWGVEKSLIAHGYTVYEVFQLMHFSAINKWRTTPHKLWIEVNKAAGA